MCITDVTLAVWRPNISTIRLPRYLYCAATSLVTATVVVIQLNTQLKSAKTHTDTVFGPHDLDLRNFDAKINGFPGLMVEHFRVKFGDPICSSF